MRVRSNIPNSVNEFRSFFFFLASSYSQVSVGGAIPASTDDGGEGRAAAVAAVALGAAAAAEGECQLKLMIQPSSDLALANALTAPPRFLNEINADEG
mmetsp:Transcript_57427/g.108072  ORF Transcript_57427/g.108072 Transcript_57427/m.108072 type:complete len:98 (+) Transcript_57427:59-352(+)